MAEERDIERWVTINGVHIPVFKSSGIKSTVNKNLDDREKQINNNKKQADKLNKKPASTSRKKKTTKSDVKKLNDLMSSKYNYDTDTDAVEKEINEWGKNAPDGTKLGIVKEETTSTYTSKGIHQSTDLDVKSLYKINGKWSFYSDGSGGEGHSFNSLVFWKGTNVKIMLLDDAYALQKNYDSDVRTKSYGIHSKWEKQ